ncbi:MAG: hypothetical protein V8R16_02520 [Bacilli bacterium]
MNKLQIIFGLNFCSVIALIGSLISLSNISISDSYTYSDLRPIYNVSWIIFFVSLISTIITLVYLIINLLKKEK